MNTRQTQLSIVVPCFNEAENLPALLARFREAMEDRRGVELLLVNNGSRDNSSTVLADLLTDVRNGFARVVEVPINQGYGFGILSGLREASGEFLAWTHADLQTDPVDVLRALDRLLEQPEPSNCLVRGRRVGRPLMDRAFTVGMGLVATVALNASLYDINAQPKVFHRSLLAAMHDAPWDFSLDLYLLYLAQTRGLQLLEQPVNFGDRQKGAAKGGGSLRGKAKLTRRTLQYIFKLREQLHAA